MSKQAKWLGPCVWNGNEIVQVEEPNKAVAGLAPDAPDEWGPLFAAAPEMYEVLEALVAASYDVTPASEMDDLWRLAERVLAKARGEA